MTLLYILGFICKRTSIKQTCSYKTACDVFDGSQFSLCNVLEVEIGPTAFTKPIDI